MYGMDPTAFCRGKYDKSIGGNRELVPVTVNMDQNGGYTVPDEFHHQLLQGLEENNIFRRLAKVINT